MLRQVVLLTHNVLKKGNFANVTNVRSSVGPGLTYIGHKIPTTSSNFNIFNLTLVFKKVFFLSSKQEPFDILITSVILGTCFGKM